MRQQEELFSGSSCFRLIDNHTKAQLQRDIINVPVQQKTDAVLFRKGPVCELDQRITLKLFAAGAATCLFSENKDAYGPIRVFYLGSKEQRYYRSSKKEKKKSGPLVWGWDALGTCLTGNLGSAELKHLIDVI